MFGKKPSTNQTTSTPPAMPIKPAQTQMGVPTPAAKSPAPTPAPATPTSPAGANVAPAPNGTAPGGAPNPASKAAPTPTAAPAPAPAAPSETPPATPTAAQSAPQPITAATDSTDIQPAASLPAKLKDVDPDSIATAVYTDQKLETPDYIKAKEILIENLLESVDFQTLEKLPAKARRERISQSAEQLIGEITIPLTAAQGQLLKSQMLDEVLGFGPLEVLMEDPDVSDIMINTCESVYIEKAGKLQLSDVSFTSEKHLLNVIQKIVSLVGRRVDETSPMVDARMPDGSRFNAIIPPLALDGSLVSIRKFKKNKMPLSAYLDYGSASPEMIRFLEICGKIRLNIIISGGTGSGKTTLLNAISGHIDMGERVITIEDAAELQMQQPHVLRLETRPANIEGTGEINQRQLVKNALRMRPDRIILGEIRAEEVIDVLAAMNTGHDGSMATIHSNNPRDCLSRIENLISMAGISMPVRAMRTQISSAVNLIVQIARMRDGSRRITHIEEIVGMEGDIITTQNLFGYKPGPMGEDGKLSGKFYSSGLRPKFLEQASYFNCDREMLECIQSGHQM